MARILVTGLNPAWQKILEFDQLGIGQVNRAKARQEFGSGKGLNAALVLRRLGHEVALLQVIGGPNGRRLEDYCRASGVTPLSVQVACETRVCTTLVDYGAGQATELIEPFSVVPEERALERLLELVDQFPSPDALLMSGSAPAGIAPDAYLEIARRAKASLVILDVVRETSPELLAEVDYVKVNAAEYEQLKNRGMAVGAGSGKPVFLVTDGPRPARLIQSAARGTEEKSLRLPELEGVVNPIGAGDTVSGYLTHALLGGHPPDNAFREALAAGSASCLTMRPGEYDEEVRRRLSAAIVVA